MKKIIIKFATIVALIAILLSSGLSAFAGTMLIQRFDGTEGKTLIDFVNFGCFKATDGGGDASYVYTSEKAKMDQACKITVNGFGTKEGAGNTWVSLQVMKMEQKDWSKAEYVEFYVDVTAFRPVSLYFNLLDGNNHRYDGKTPTSATQCVAMIESTPGQFKEKKSSSDNGIWLDKTFKGRVRYKLSNFENLKVSQYSPADANSEASIDWTNVKEFQLGFGLEKKNGVCSDIGKYLIVDNLGINGANIASNYTEPVVSVAQSSEAVSVAASSVASTGSSSTLSSASSSTSSEISSVLSSGSDIFNSSNNTSNSSNNGQWIAIVVASVILLAGAGAAVYFFIIKRKA